MILRRYFVFYQFFFSLNVISGSVLRFKTNSFFFLVLFLLPPVPSSNTCDIYESYYYHKVDMVMIILPCPTSLLAMDIRRVGNIIRV